MSKLEPGCWIRTVAGDEACLTEIKYCPYTKKDWARYRYEAKRFDGVWIWVANSDPLEEVTFLDPPRPESAAILRLQGPYGIVHSIRWSPALSGWTARKRKGLWEVTGTSTGRRATGKTLNEALERWVRAMSTPIVGKTMICCRNDACIPYKQDWAFGEVKHIDGTSGAVTFANDIGFMPQWTWAWEISDECTHWLLQHIKRIRKSCVSFRCWVAAYELPEAEREAWLDRMNGYEHV